MKQHFLLLAATATLVGACDSQNAATTTARAELSAPEVARQPAAPLPNEAPALPAQAPAATAPTRLDGAALYAGTCQACHQATGQGLPNAFPSLVGSPRVAAADGAQLVSIILNGYNERPEYGVMPGYAASMSDDQVAAVATHVRTAWGNASSPVTAALVRKLRATK